MGRGLGPFEAELIEALVRRPEGVYGVALAEEVSRRAGRPVSLGAVYTTLERLERKRLVSSRWGDPQAVRGGRRRRYYAATPQGRDALKNA